MTGNDTFTEEAEVSGRAHLTGFFARHSGFGFVFIIILATLVAVMNPAPRHFHGERIPNYNDGRLTRIRLASRTPSAHKVDDETYQQNQTKSSPSDHGATEVKTASAKQKKKNKY